MRRSPDRGVVLLWAVAALGILTALGVGLGRRAIDARDGVWGMVARAQADALARSAVTIATAVLEAHVASGTADTLHAPWAAPMRQALGAGHVEVVIEDLGRRIDLNAVEMRPVLARLAERLSLPPTLVPSLADWTDADDDARRHGAEVAWYAAQPAALRPPNAPLASLHHLRFVRGGDTRALARLAPHVTVDGQPTLNPNTASEPVLHAWLGDPAAVARIVRERDRRPVDCVGLQRCTLHSRRFLLRVTGRVGTIRRRADVVVLIAPGLGGTIERWEPPVVLASDGGSERRRGDRLAQLSQ